MCYICLCDIYKLIFAIPYIFFTLPCAFKIAMLHVFKVYTFSLLFFSSTNPTRGFRINSLRINCSLTALLGVKIL